MSHQEIVYAEGTHLDAVVGIIGALVAILIIFSIVFSTNNGNNPPAWTGVTPAWASE